MQPAVVARVHARARDMCEWCYRGPGPRPLELHHIVIKGMGGRRHTRETSDSAENLVQLCSVCHAAAHGETQITADWSCRVCHKADTCPVSRAGARMA